MLLPLTQAQVPAPFVAVRAELARDVDTATWKTGDTFFLNTMTAWQSGACAVRANTTITGEVVRAEQQAGGKHRSRASLRFRPVPCAGVEDTNVLPLLVAVAVAPPPANNALQRMATASMENQQMANLFSDAHAAAAAGIKQDFVTNRSSNAAQAADAGSMSGVSPEPQLKTGEVHGIRGVSLELPQGEPATTLVFSHEVTLQKHTRFLLLLSAAADGAARGTRQTGWSVASNTSEPAGSTKLPALALQQAKKPEPAVCVPGGCRQASAVKKGAGEPAWRLALVDEGWTPRSNRTITALDDAASIHALGEDQLLVTFPLHTLLRRTQGQFASNAQPRQVRALLIAQKDGATELEGRLAPFQFLQQAQTNAAGDLLAVATTQFDKRMDLAGSLREGEFTQLLVAVYSLATGKAIFAAQAKAGSALSETFALAPSGKSLALLTEAGVEGYTIPAVPVRTEHASR